MNFSHPPHAEIASSRTYRDYSGALVKTRLKRIQYSHGLLQGFLAQTGLTLQAAAPP